MNKKNDGFTIVELLIVVTIIGILTAITIPAIQSVRESARNVSCTNNLRNIGFAVENYQSVNGHLPKIGGSIRPRPEGHRATVAFSWLVLLLPFLDQDNLYQQFNANEDSSSDFNHQLATENRPAVLVCPSDPSSINSGNYTNYLGNVGVHPSLGRHFGPISVGEHSFSVTDIRRGLSNVLFAAESGVFSRDSGNRFDRGRLRFPSESVIRGDPYRSYRRATLNAAASIYDSTLGELWFPASVPDNTYNHAMEPNTKSCRFPLEDVRTPSSHHPGGVNTLRCDASTHSVSDSVNLTVWIEFGTNDVVSYSFLEGQ